MHPMNGGAVHRRIAILAVVASTLLLMMGLSAGQALAAGDDDIPGVPVGAGTVSGIVDDVTDPHDVYSVKLFEGEPVHFHIDASSGSAMFDNVGVHVIAPGATSIHSYYSEVAYFGTHPTTRPDADYTPAKDGVYYLSVACRGQGMSYTITITGSAEKPPNPAYLRLRTSATKVKKGRSVTLSAKLVDVRSVLISGYSAKLYRSYNGRSWKKITTLASSTGKYSKRVRITRKTWFKMRFGGNSTWSSCNSRKVTVRPR